MSKLNELKDFLSTAKINNNVAYPLVDSAATEATENGVLSSVCLVVVPTYENDLTTDTILLQQDGDTEYEIAVSGEEPVIQNVKAGTYDIVSEDGHTLSASEIIITEHVILDITISSPGE